MRFISKNYIFPVMVLAFLSIFNHYKIAAISNNLFKIKCPKNYFMVDNMTYCHPLLTCSDLENVKFLKLIGYGAVKWVFLAEWKHILIAVSILKNSLYSNDFENGLNILRSLKPNHFVVQLVGYCKHRSIIATEYHRLNNANSLKYILRERALSFDLSMKLCLNFVELLNFLHQSPIGARVNCDSDSVDKILSQIVINNKLELVFCDVDALPEYIHNITISCGRNMLPKPASLVPPELADSTNPGYSSGYSVKSDVWKIPDVCHYFFSLANADALSFSVFDITRKCKNNDPSKRPSTKELMNMYREQFENLRTESYNEAS